MDAENPDSSKRPAFGNRTLENPSDVFKHNAWDSVIWNDEQEDLAKCKVAQQAVAAMDPSASVELLQNASTAWDSFYDVHENRFFKNRYWLFTEFPELLLQEGSVPQCLSPTAPAILEVGCGVGNTVFPLLEALPPDSGCTVYCCDFSIVAIDHLKKHPDFNENRCIPFVWDITQDVDSIPVSDGSIDIILMIFVLSALEPSKMAKALQRLARLLRPGGCILFRDYGQYDMAQLRFKSGRYIKDNFYARGDRTCVYFFQQSELHRLFESAGLAKELNWVDRRLQVNRGKGLKMYRVWIQCRYRKPVDGEFDKLPDIVS